MFGWLTGNVAFRLRLTYFAFKRWNRLIDKLGYRYEEENEVLLEALGLYWMLTDWASVPLFVLDDDGEPERFDLVGMVGGPIDAFAYDRRYRVSRKQWLKMRALLKRSGEKDMDHLVDRSLKLLERVLDGKHPQLYTLDELGDFRKARIRIE